MNEETQKEIFKFFAKNKIENFVGVPDSTLKHFISEGIKHEKILIANREEEAIGIGTGMILADSPTIMFMQNAGFANSISTITSLVQLYQIPRGPSVDHRARTVRQSLGGNRQVFQRTHR